MADASELALRIARHMLAGEGMDWGISIEDVEPGYARITMKVRADMTNSHGLAHGGLIFSLADTALAYAANSYNQVTVTAAASIVFLAPARLGDLLVAEARETVLAGRNGVYSVFVRKEDGSPIAQLQGQSRSMGGAVIGLA